MKKIYKSKYFIPMLLMMITLLLSGCGDKNHREAVTNVANSNAVAIDDVSVDDSDFKDDTPLNEAETSNDDLTTAIDENGTYTSKEDVALYIYTYNKLPSNFITKKQAEKLGWQGGGLDEYMDGGCIGGNYFGNYEGLLPERAGREYHECDIDTMHKSKRGAKRIIYSNDGLIYYTEDHYESFELLYGEE